MRKWLESSKNLSLYFPLVTIQTIASTMASNQSNKRHKTTSSPFETEATRKSMQLIVDSILNVDREAFREFARNMDRETFKLLSTRLSELGQDMENTLTKFADIPSIVIASNVFPYLGNRNDWNNFSMVNKDIHRAVTNHKQLEPPWPEGDLMDESIDEGSILNLPTFSPDSKFIAHGDDNGNIYLWSRTKGLIANWLGHDTTDHNVIVGNVIFSPDGNLLVTVAANSSIKIWDLANDNRCLREWTQDRVFTVAFSPDGKLIATAGGFRQPVYLRYVSDGTNFRVITPALEALFSAVFSPDGRTLALGGHNEYGHGYVQLWKLDEADDTSFSLIDYPSYVNDLAYSPDGSFLASASSDGIQLWDVATNCCVQILKGNTVGVTSIAFTPDGEFLASADRGYVIRLWSVTSGNCIEAIVTDTTVRKVEFSPDNRMLLSTENIRTCLHSMDTYMLHALREERAALMKLDVRELQEELTGHDIRFDLESTKVALIDLLVKDLDQNQRKEIIMRKKTEY
jgi:WD40 repeat protein